MEPDLFRFDESPRFGRKRVNFFAWTIVIILLCGVALAAWLGSFYVLGQPERPESYRILQKLHKIEAPKRFELTAAPAGEFLTPKQLYSRYLAMGPTELARKNAELLRNFIRNFQQVHGLVTYVVGRFNIMGTRELTPEDVFSSGAVALTTAVDQPELLMEHVFTTADDHDARLLKQMLAMGMDINLERSHDLSAVIHVERLPDGRIQITAIPLLYGSYAVTRGTGTFSLEPPATLHLTAGWPLFKPEMLQAVDTRYASYREKLAPTGGALPIAGLTSDKTARPPEDALVRVEPAVALEEPPGARPSSRLAHNRPATTNGIDHDTTLAMAKNSPGARIRRAQPVTPEDETQPNEQMTAASPGPRILPAIPVTSPSPGMVIASTNGATWKTYAPGTLPTGRLLDTAGLREVANNGTRGERVYLSGDFVVNFADGNRAVLRPVSGGTGNIARSARIIVDYPAGAHLPEPGSKLSRDSSRPYEVTEVRQQADGQLNVFVREVIKPD